MNKKARAMIMAAFTGDALSLGVHWIYNTRVIDKKYGRVTDMLAPKLASFHKGKNKGEFTHYGDQSLCLLESIAAGGGFDLDRFADDWRALFDTYEGYRDQATKDTLENFSAGMDASAAGSASDDLGGPARMAPLIYRYRNDPSRLIAAVRDQTSMTHTGPEIVDAADFFARTVLAVFDGTPPREALETVLSAHFNRAPFTEWVSQGLASITTDTRDAIMGFGQMCELPAAFPATIHLIARYPDDLEQAQVENIMAGGDSAARGMIAGMVLGAHLGPDQIPARWTADLTARSRIEDLLNQIDASVQSL